MHGSILFPLYAGRARQRRGGYRRKPCRVPLCALSCKAGTISEIRRYITFPDDHPQCTKKSDGVWFVDLAPLTDPALAANTIINTLGLKEAGDKPPLQALIEHLKTRRLLLLLDNCEHLLDSVARIAEMLLEQCPGVKLLATSREKLNIPGESIYRVPSLTLPDSAQNVSIASLLDYEALSLFVERAYTAKADFMVTEKNIKSLVSICHRLDGTPLAIELAAARVRVMPMEQIETRLDNRFRLLTGGNRASLPRHETLRALMDWSYDLLEAMEKRLLHRLSVFTGGWTLEAAEEVCIGAGIEEWDVLDLLTSLVDQSLVVYVEHEGKARYGLLQTVRQYAREKREESGEGPLYRNRHRDYFLALAETAEPKLMGAEQGSGFSVWKRSMRTCGAVWNGAFRKGEQGRACVSVEPWQDSGGHGDT